MTNYIKSLAKIKTIKSAEGKKCIKCNKIVMKEDNTKKNICQYCKIMIDYVSGERGSARWAALHRLLY